MSNYQTAHRALKLLAVGPSRLVVQLLREQGEMSVTDIYIRLRTDQSVVSLALMKLRESGIVESRRSGKNIFYSICKYKYEALEYSAKVINGLRFENQ